MPTTIYGNTTNNYRAELYCDNPPTIWIDDYWKSYRPADRIAYSGITWTTKIDEIQEIIDDIEDNQISKKTIRELLDKI